MIVRATILYPRLARSGGLAPLCVLESILDLPLRLGAYCMLMSCFETVTASFPKWILGDGI